MPKEKPMTGELGSIAGYEDIEISEQVVEENAPIEETTTLPEYSGEPYYSYGELTLTEEERARAKTSYIKLSELDELGRCGPSEASLSLDTLPGSERESIGMVKPTGWHTVRYDDLIEDKYLFNRCHLLAHCLTGLNADERNLVTGTRYMNVSGMLPFETETVKYIERTGNHVFYRVTPIFEGNDLVCKGVLMEAASIEDNEINFKVFCYNVQPGITIDYATGESGRI